MEAHLLFVDCKSGYRAVRGQVAIISWCATEPGLYPELVERQTVVVFAGPGRDRRTSLNSICLQQPLRAGPTNGFYVTRTCQSHYAFIANNPNRRGGGTAELTGGTRWRLRCQSGHRPQPRRVKLFFVCTRMFWAIRGPTAWQCSVGQNPGRHPESRAMSICGRQSKSKLHCSGRSGRQLASGRRLTAGSSATRSLSLSVAPSCPMSVVSIGQQQEHRLAATAAAAAMDKSANQRDTFAARRLRGAGVGPIGCEPDELRGFRVPSAAKLNSPGGSAPTGVAPGKVPSGTRAGRPQIT